MTRPSEVTISDADGKALLHHMNLRVEAGAVETAKQFLAQWMAARVPGAKDWKAWMQFDPSAEMKQPRQGFNACRDAVLNGGSR